VVLTVVVAVIVVAEAVAVVGQGSKFCPVPEMWETKMLSKIRGGGGTKKECKQKNRQHGAAFCPTGMLLFFVLTVALVGMGMGVSLY
jgi:hypothetical protein